MQHKANDTNKTDLKKSQPAGDNNDQPSTPKKRRKKHVKSACFNCHLAKRACEDARPCGRCKIRNLKCNPIQPPTSVPIATPLRTTQSQPASSQFHLSSISPAASSIVPQHYTIPPLSTSSLSNSNSASSSPRLFPSSPTLTSPLSPTNRPLSPTLSYPITLNSSLALAFSPTSVNTTPSLISASADNIHFNPLSTSSSFTSTGTFYSSLSSSPPYIIHPLGNSAPSIISSFLDDPLSAFHHDDNYNYNINTNPLSCSNGFISSLTNLNFGVDKDIENEEISSHIISNASSKDLESTIAGLISSSGDLTFVPDSPIIVEPNAETNNEANNQISNQINNQLNQVKTEKNIQYGNSYTDAFDYSSTPYSMWDIQTQRLVACNAAFQTMLGYSRDELTSNFYCNQMVPQRYHPELQKFWNFMKSVAPTDTTVEMKLIVHDKVGIEKCVKTSILPVSGNNNVCMMKHVLVNMCDDKWSIGDFVHFQTLQVSPQQCNFSMNEIGKAWDVMSKDKWN